MQALMNIFVKMPSGNTIALGVGASETIATGRIIIADLTCAQQLLTCAGRVFERWGTLAAYNIQNESTLHCALLLRGGGGGQDGRNVRPRLSPPFVQGRASVCTSLVSIRYDSRQINSKRNRQATSIEQQLSFAGSSELLG